MPPVPKHAAIRQSPARLRAAGAIAAAAILLLAPLTAQGDDAAAAAERGRNLAAGCAICHGSNGVSRDVVPSLAGMREADLVVTMQAYKAGARQGTVMPQLARGYSDAQIALIARWFAEQPR